MLGGMTESSISQHHPSRSEDCIAAMTSSFPTRRHPALSKPYPASDKDERDCLVRREALTKERDGQNAREDRHEVHEHACPARSDFGDAVDEEDL